VREVDHGGDVEQNLLLLALRVEAIEGPIGGEAGVVDQEIDGQAALLRGREHLLPCLGTAEIARKRLGANAMLRGKARSQVAQFRFGAGDEDQVRALRGERAREGGADTRGGPRDQGCFSGIQSCRSHHTIGLLSLPHSRAAARP